MREPLSRSKTSCCVISHFPFLYLQYSILEGACQAPFSDFLGRNEASVVVGVEVDITAVMGVRSQSQQESLVGRPLGVHAETVRDERQRVHH